MGIAAAGNLTGTARIDVPHLPILFVPFRAIAAHSVLAGIAWAPEYLVTMPKAPPCKILVLAICSVVSIRCAKVDTGTPGGGNSPQDASGSTFSDALRSSTPDGVVIASSVKLTCGNGKLDTGEMCDDGNTKNGDGCTQLCQIEADFVCPTPGQPCTTDAKCGDGKLASIEACDDGNATGGDGCSADCTKVEPGYQCRVPGKSCIPLCGDGMKIGSEMCDDGNAMSGDGCSSTCQLEPGATCPAPGMACTTAVCGNGKLETGETCDAGPMNGLFLGDGTGCSKTCTTEPKCRDGATTHACDVTCGNGNLELGEDCDDGNTADGDGCSSKCKTEGGFMCPPMLKPDSEPCVGSTDPTVKCLHLPVIVRDFKSEKETGGHPDFLYYGAPIATPITIAGVLNQPAPFSFSKRYCVPNSSGPARKNDSTARCWDLATPTLDAKGKPAFNTARASGNLCDFQFTDYSHDTNGGNVPGYTQVANGPTQGLVYTAGPVGHPQYKGPAPIIKDATSFGTWWVDSAYDNMTHSVVTIELGPFGAGQFQFSSNPNSITGGFFPADPPGAGAFPPSPMVRTVPGTNEPLLCNLWPYWYSSAAFGAGANCVANQYLFPPSIPATAMCPAPGAGQSMVPCAGGVWAPMTQGTFHNSWYTTEARYLFNFNGAFSLQFYGDDDLFIYVNGHLVIDLGGVHQRLPGQVIVDAMGMATITEGGEVDAAGAIIPCTATAVNPYTLGVSNATCPGGTCDCRTRTLDLGLKAGSTYEIAVFHADQHPTESNYQLTLSGFSTTRSVCQPKCGDGVKSGGEECDDGMMNSDTTYGGCSTQCKFGPFCGDGMMNGPEECDLGRANGAPYGTMDGCTTACKHPHYCGDGNVDAAYGEKCDLGPNNGTMGAPCDAKCQVILG